MNGSPTKSLNPIYAFTQRTICILCDQHWRSGFNTTENVNRDFKFSETPSIL